MYTQKAPAPSFQDAENLFGSYAEVNAVKKVTVEQRDGQLEFIAVISPAAIKSRTDILTVPFAPRTEIPAVEIRISPWLDVDFVWKAPRPPLAHEVKWSLHATQAGGTLQAIGPLEGLLGSSGVDGFCHHKGALPGLTSDISTLRLGFIVQMEQNDRMIK